ncbi:hypothetical protein HOLleu_12069 [Holothuria leucospilota]|uniref:Uncharacterized protein n=1 Tax=Holothuria leucospilota TaxID=206669 RepID=A0A9Q1CAU4_HOLLE|nr:hypothetical protein HOLleu_12069 [Holothuria leucospilota]
MASTPDSNIRDQEVENFLQVVSPARRGPPLSSLRNNPLPPVGATSASTSEAIETDRNLFKRLHDNSNSYLALNNRSNILSHELTATTSNPSQEESMRHSPICCQRHWVQHREEHRHEIPATIPFRDTMTPPRPASTALRNLRKKDNLVKLVDKDMHDNERRQAPMSTICVRWHKLRNDPGYTTDSLLHCLRPLGDIESVVITSECTARVTFGRLDDACAATAAKNLGRRQNPLLCRWYHKAMENKSFSLKRDHLHVIYNPFLK